FRDALSERAYRHENATLRDSAKPLGAVRDARVLVESLDDLVSRESLDPKEATGFREALEREEHDLRRKVARDGQALQGTRASLRDARERISRSKLDSRGWRDVGHGLQRVYAHGRKALRASRAKGTTACLHEWRKQSKYLLHQLELLQPIAPGPIDE